jgi:SAM-dependent methyltransferase
MNWNACNVCGENLDPRFPEVRDPLTNESFTIVRCRRCNLGHTVPQPEDLGRYYREPYYGDRHAYTLRHCNNRRMGFVSAALPVKKGMRLLDIGCGDGSFLLAARDAGWQVMGTELSPDQARRTGLDVRESIDQVQEGAGFDCITMWHTLEHMKDIPTVLSHVARLLVPEGRLIVAVPDAGGLQARLFGPKWFHADVPRHLFHFDKKSLSFALASAGFTVLRQWHQEIEYDLLGWSQSALNYLMPHPNVFYNYLTGKRGLEGPMARSTGIVLGSLMTALFLPMLAAGTLLRKGGTLIAVAARQGLTSS